MATKESSASVSAAPFLNFGQQGAKEAAALQKEFFEVYEETSRAWLARAQSEAALWSELAAKLASTRSVSEAVEAYTKCVSQQMQMSAEDGQRMINDCQQFAQRLTKPFSNGKPTAST
jgi:hypothetical protein